MVAKEWRDARWKFLVAALSMLLAVVAVPIPLLSYEDIVKEAKQPAYSFTLALGEGADRTQQPKDARMREELKTPEGLREPRNPIDLATGELFASYLAGGFFVLFPLAGLLGVSLISGEVSGGTIFLMLCRPVGRSQVLLAKYGVGAVTLLAAALLGGVLLVVAAALRGYPVGRLGLNGLVFSAVLVWLGSLFVLGVALLASIVFRSVIGSIVAAALALCLAFTLPGLLLSTLYSVQARFFGMQPGFNKPGVVEAAFQSLNLTYYWTGGEGSAVTNLAVSLIAAALPPLVGLWLFNRKAY